MLQLFIHPLLYRYLQKDKVNGPEGSTVYYELAERALDAPMSDRVKEHISQVVFWKSKLYKFVVSSFFTKNI